MFKTNPFSQFIISSLLCCFSLLPGVFQPLMAASPKNAAKAHAAPSPQFLYNSALALSRQNRCDEAEKRFEQALAHAGKNTGKPVKNAFLKSVWEPRAIFDEGACYYRKQDYPQAESLLKQAASRLTQSGPPDRFYRADAELMLGIIAHKQKRTDEAEVLYQSALKDYQPDIRHHTLQIGIARHNLEVLRQQPINSQATSLLATAGNLFNSNLSHMGSQDPVIQNQALQYFGQALALGEQTHNKAVIGKASEGLGYIYAQQHNETQALHYLEQAIALQPHARLAEQSSMVSKLRQASYNLGHYQEAKVWNERLAALLADSGATSDNRASNPATPDFLPPDAKIYRWSDKKKYVMVYIAPATYLQGWHPENIDRVKAAFAEWQQALGNKFQFLFMPDADNADVVVNWQENPFGTENLGETDAPTHSEILGHNVLQTWGKYMAHNDIDLSLTDGYGNLLLPHDIQTIALHEIGHMLGIRQHSDNMADVMAPSIRRDLLTAPKHLTTRDVNTMIAIYNRKPDFTNPDGYTLSHFEQFKKTQQHKGFWFPILIPIPL